MSRLFHGPGDWLGGRFSARDRRSIATWVMILLAATIPLRYPFRTYVSMVWALSELALLLAMWGVVSAETPVEEE